MTTEAKRKFLIDIAFYSVTIILIYFSLKFLSFYLLPFVIGIFVSSLVQKPVNAISQKFKISKSPLTIGFVVATYLLIISALILVSYLIYHCLGSTIEFLPNILPDFFKIADNINASFSNSLKGLPPVVNDYITSLPSKLNGAVTSLGISLSNWALDLLTAIPSFLISSVVTIVASCYIAYEYDKIILFTKTKTPTKIWDLIITIKNIFFKNILKILKGYILLMFLTFIELSIGFLLLGQTNAIFIAAIISVIDILPVLGTGVIIIPWALFSIFTGNIWKAIGLIIIYVIITIIRNFLEPKIIGSQVGLHPLLTLLSMFCGLKILGIIGLFIFPLALIIINNLYKLGKIKLKSKLFFA